MELSTLRHRSEEALRRKAGAWRAVHDGVVRRCAGRPCSDRHGSASARLLGSGGAGVSEVRRAGQHSAGSPVVAARRDRVARVGSGWIGCSGSSGSCRSTTAFITCSPIRSTLAPMRPDARAPVPTSRTDTSGWFTASVAGGDEWEVLIRDHHDGYITWAEYERNQKVIADNANCQGAAARGSIRQGEALLAGLVRCGRCGRKPACDVPGGPASAWRATRAGRPRQLRISADLEHRFRRKVNADFGGS